MPEQQDHGGEAAWLGVFDWGLRWKLWEGMSWPWKRVESKKKSCAGRSLRDMAAEVTEDSPGELEGRAERRTQLGKHGVRGGRCWNAGGG